MRRWWWGVHMHSVVLIGMSRRGLAWRGVGWLDLPTSQERIDTTFNAKPHTIMPLLSSSSLIGPPRFCGVVCSDLHSLILGLQPWIRSSDAEPRCKMDSPCPQSLKAVKKIAARDGRPARTGSCTPSASHGHRSAV